jgi:DMSO/TMAO reductase YedYZ heme-binding membrane subunit
VNGPRLVLAATLVLLVLFAGTIAVYGSDEAGLRTLVRATARASFLIFIAAYAASAARRLFPSPATRWLLRNRRYLGLSFAVAHLLHLDAIWLLSLLLGQAFAVDLATLVFGGIAYGFVFAMALTSNDRAVAWLGPRRWNTLHRVGIHWIWAVFSFDWLVLALFESPTYAPIAVLALAGLGLRIAARRARARPGSAVAASPA